MRSYFISGGTGLIGSEFLRRILTWESDSHACILLRGRSDALVRSRARALMLDMFPDPAEREKLQARLSFVRGNIALPQLGLETGTFAQLADEVTDICHFAADVRFDLSLEQARAINLEGTKQMFELARRAAKRPDFRRFHQVSTFAVARPQPGDSVVYEVPPSASTRYNNSYEQTKAESELYVLERKDEVPLSIYRPSTVVGDSHTGWTADFKVAYIIMKQFAAGAFNPDHVIEFQEGARSDGVNVNYVANCIHALCRRPQPTTGAIYNLVAGHSATTPSEWFRRASGALCASLERRGLPAPKPMRVTEISRLEPDSMRYWLKDPSAFEALVQFFPYITGHTVYDDRNTRGALKGIEGCTLSPRLSDLPVLMDYCVESGWGVHAGRRPTLGVAPYGA